ncbi:hypothetical protein E2C01_070606 [Portunus trituberculatus]|uniref:Uncharacterized protein n=1 Tax=Portunus trituberculatus TaxID=210409 RepID=A0A5B7I2Q8_PORTR|nr:hypothetical protein [Portunus trituberculatus]
MHRASSKQERQQQAGGLAVKQAKRGREAGRQAGMQAGRRPAQPACLIVDTRQSLVILVV